MITIKDIIDTVATYYRLPYSKIVKHRRTRTIVEARQVAMYISRSHTNHSYEEISESFNRDRATVIYGIKSINEKCNNDPRISNIVANLSGRVERIIEGKKDVCTVR